MGKSWYFHYVDWAISHYPHYSQPQHPQRRRGAGSVAATLHEVHLAAAAAAAAAAAHLAGLVVLLGRAGKNGGFFTGQNGRLSDVGSGTHLGFVWKFGQLNRNFMVCDDLLSLSLLKLPLWGIQHLQRHPNGAEVVVFRHHRNPAWWTKPLTALNTLTNQFHNPLWPISSALKAWEPTKTPT